MKQVFKIVQAVNAIDNMGNGVEILFFPVAGNTEYDSCAEAEKAMANYLTGEYVIIQIWKKLK